MPSWNREPGYALVSEQPLSCHWKTQPGSAQIFVDRNRNGLNSVRDAILVADATAPDHPIVYANPAFEMLTGYSSNQILGRNCRFLQGTDRDQPARHIIREALSDERPVRAVLRNYRKDGSLFYNELFIDPIFGHDLSVTHFISSQNAIADWQEADVLQRAHYLFERLTVREREVFQLIASGYSNKSVARELCISHRTAEKHRMNVLHKFEVTDVTLLVRYAIGLGIPFRPLQDRVNVSQR